MSDLSVGYSSDRPPYDDGVAQLDALSDDTELVTVGIVGNDLNFSGTVESCVKYSIANNIDTEKQYDYSCATNLGSEVADGIEDLRDGALRDRLLGLYGEIRERAPYARVVVVSYPEFFPEDGHTGSCGWVARPSDQAWMNYSIRKADRIIGVLADEAGFEYVKMDDVLRGHEQCTEEEAMNGIKGVIWATDPGSYHPNRLGHELMADRIQGQIELDEPSTHIIGPNVTLTQKFTFSGRRVTVNVGWPGSDVVTTLISPSGVRYTRDDARDAAHTNGPTWETFTIEDPEPGEWTIEMFGADVDPEGEPVDLVVTDTPDWNAEPVADINVTRIDDDTYRFDATGSTDADGEITGYEWDFGDSVTMVPGAVVEHTFAPGDFKVALVVTDDDGGLDLTTTEGTITVAEPNRASDIVIRSGTQFTNQLQITGDTFIDGNLQCNSAATIDGRLTVAGTLHLTNDCAIEGDVIATGDVTLDSRSSITGDLTSAGSIQMQSSSTVTGTIAVTGALTIIDGVSVDALIASGHIGAVELQHPVLTVTGPVQEATEVATTTMWRQWLNTLARQSGAPPWSPGLSASPGCTIARWTINAADVVVTESLAIDARRTATGCSAIQIQGTSLTLSSDLTLYVDSFAASNGLRVRSADGDAHRLRIIVTDGDPSCANNTIRLIGDTDIDPLIDLDLTTPGGVNIHGNASLNARIDAGCFATSGKVRLGVS